MVESKTGKNPWEDITVDSLLRSIDKTNPWESNQAYVSPEDRDYVRNNNLRLGVSGNDDYRFHLELPPEPWQGNPKKAKVIILTLNPGYVESANTVIAKLLKKAKCYKRLIRFKERVLKLDADSMMPKKTASKSNEITTFEAFNALGDWYWYKQLRELREEYCSCREKESANIPRYKLENDFYRKFAVVEYCAYTSKSFSDSKHIDKLPSVDYVRKLILDLKDKSKIFVVLRAKGKWEKALGAGVIENKEKFIVNKNMSQAFSRNNLGQDNFDLILRKLLGK